jgi:tRNA dimethylallyltransferase
MALAFQSSRESLWARSIFLAGPTAVGKSALALEIAERVRGEIISVDSMQVYRGLDIGTAKATAEERARVRHHLIDVCELDEEFNAARFIQLAAAAAEEIVQQGHVPVFCGGTGLYFKALIEGIGEAPPGDASLRAQLESTPPDILLAELKNADPATYDRIDRRNLRRVVRAVEVVRLTGKPVGAQRAKWFTASDRLPRPRLFGLKRTTMDLSQRIEARVEEMFARGLVAETRKLLGEGLERNRVAMQALGYRQVEEYLRGVRSLKPTIDLVKTRSRQFARRQMTWFRTQLPMEWLELEPETILAQTAEHILERIRAARS